jgi:hypothetical protein
MDVKAFRVELSTIDKLRPFVEQWHYSKSVNGLRLSYCFALRNGEQLIGAALFGGLAMANVWKKYAEKEEDLIELRRLCCIDDTPKNTESFFISKCLLWIKKNTQIKRIISYADTNYNHQGIIYQASNFKRLGETAKGRVILWNGKKYHDKAIRTKYKGRLKPFAARVKAALETGEAFYKEQKGKVIYLYEFTRSS